jgi:hypothetical protein
MKKKPFNLIAIALLIISTVPSCQKVIHVDLNGAAPQLVVVGNVTDQPGPYVVTLSQTVNFSDDNVFPPVSGQEVIITDNTGISETLTESSPGNYQTSILQGAIGRTYSISVAPKGKNYSATSTMPVAVNIDSLLVETSSGRGFNKTKKISLHVIFKDPTGIANYYHFIEIVNGIQSTDFFITSDKYQDGANIDYNLSAQDSTLNSGDSVLVILQSIDNNVYEYFRTLNQVASGGGLQTSTPGNPTTNLSNNALGYFSACSVRSKKIKIP